MSAILDALNKGPKDPKKSGNKGSFSYQAEAEGVRARRGKRFWAFVLLPVPIFILCVTASLVVYSKLDSGKKTVVSSSKASETPVTKPSPAASSPEPSEEQVQQLMTEVQFMKQTIDRLTEEKARASRPTAAVPAAAPANSGLPVAPPPRETVAEAAPPSNTPAVRVEPPAEQRPRPPLGDPPALKLEGTMVTQKGPSAMVNGQMVFVGDSVENWEITEVGDGYIKVRNWPKRIYIK